MRIYSQAIIEQNAVLRCVVCGRDIGSDTTVFPFRGPTTFACRQCVTRYINREHGRGTAKAEQFSRPLTPDAAMRQRIRFLPPRLRELVKALCDEILNSRWGGNND